MGSPFGLPKWEDMPGFVRTPVSRLGATSPYPVFGLQWPEGMITMGNIDISQRPRVLMPDGKTATINSRSYNIDGREVLIPGVPDEGGRIMDYPEDVQRYKDTHKFLGIFDTPEHATAYANRLHLDQERRGKIKPIGLK